MSELFKTDGKLSVPQPAGKQVADWYEEEEPNMAAVLHALAHMKGERDELARALEQVQEILGIRKNFVPLGPALECAPIISAVLEKVKG